MAILNIAASLFVLAAPQQPDSPAQPVENPFVHAAAFPRDTTVLVSWNADTDTPWERAVATLPEELRESIPHLFETFALRSGLTPDELDLLRSGSYSFGLTSVGADGTPDWFVVAEFGERTDEVIGALDRVTDTAGHDARMWSFTTPDGQTVACGRSEGHLLIAPETAAIDAALARFESTEENTGSILDSQRFQRFLEQCGDEATSNDAFLAAYVDLTNVFEVVGGLVPPAQQETYSRVVGALALRQIFALGYIAHDVDGKVYEHTRICFPEPRTGFPALFAAAPTRLEPSLAEYVPADTPSFSLFHLETSKFLDETLALVTTFDADVGAQIRTGIQQLSQSSNIDIENDVLAALGRRFVIMQWPAQDDFDGIFMISLRNPLTIGKALRNTRQFKTGVIDGFEIYRHAALPLTIAIGDDNLLIGTSRTRLDQVLANKSEGNQHPQIANLIANAPKGTTGLSWTDTATLCREALGYTQMWTSELPMEFRTSLEEMLPSLGTLSTTIITDGSGISARSHSPLGTPGTVAAIVHAAAVSYAGETDPNFAAESSNLRASFSWRLGEIARVVRDSDDKNLAALASNGALTEDLVGTQVGHNLFEVDDYLLTLMTDKDDATRFALVAWPKDTRRGDVFTCTEQGVAMVNEVLTHTAGIEQIALGDVFLEGRMGNEFATGWTRIDLVSDVVDGAESGGIEISGQDWTDYQALVSAEKGDIDLEVRTLLDHVQSSNVAVSARASHTIAELQLRDAVPSLCEIATTLVDDVARRQVMQTLYSLEDPRAVPVAREMLVDPDLTIRALAAGIVGRYQDAKSTQPLIDLLARREPRPDAADRIQALLSLADIGDPVCLDLTAGAPFSGEKHEQALAYLFQQLSPKLDSEAESASLMAVLDHESMMLRRYAIQRLGEMRDPKSATALEHRLASEGPELRPLIEVSLAAVRGSSASTNANPTSRAAEGPLAGIQNWYRGLNTSTRNMMIAGSAGLALLLLGLIVVMIRRRSAGSDTDWAAMAAPSEEHVEANTPADAGYVEGGEAVYEAGAVDDDGFAEHDVDALDPIYDDEVDYSRDGEFDQPRT